MNGAKEMAKQTALSAICLFRVSEYPVYPGGMPFYAAEQKNMKCRNKMA